MLRNRLLFITLYWLIGCISASLAGNWANTELTNYPIVTQGQRVRSSGLIYGEQRLSQIIAVPQEGMTAVQFWLLAHQRRSGEVILRITTPQQRTTTIAEVHIPLADLPLRPPVTFALPHLTAATTPVVLFTLEAPALDRAHAITVFGGDNSYGQGMLLINGSARPHEDLAFTTLANSYQGDQLFPFSRIAQNRPGIFGQPGLYAALLCVGVWTYLWTAIYLGIWLWDRQKKQTSLPNQYITRRLTDT